jgi:hypothetical protein
MASTTKEIALERLARGREMRIERSARARRGPQPEVAASLTGKPDPEEVERWTSCLPAKPPGRP